MQWSLGCRKLWKCIDWDCSRPILCGLCLALAVALLLFCSCFLFAFADILSSSQGLSITLVFLSPSWWVCVLYSVEYLEDSAELYNSLSSRSLYPLSAPNLYFYLTYLLCLKNLSLLLKANYCIWVQWKKISKPSNCLKSSIPSYFSSLGFTWYIAY